MERKKLYRSQTDKMVGGVAGGLGSYLDIDSTIIRLIFVLLSFAGGNGLLIYLVLWLVMPIEPTPSGISTVVPPVVTPEPEAPLDHEQAP